MNYTLDSVEHAKQVLINETKLKIKDFTPVFITDLEELVTKQNRYYFGVLTLGNNVQTGILKYADNDLISCIANSQIIQLFQSLECIEDTEVESTSIYSFEGCFRGFEIVLG